MSAVPPGLTAAAQHPAAAPALQAAALPATVPSAEQAAAADQPLPQLALPAAFAVDGPTALAVGPTGSAFVADVAAAAGQRPAAPSAAAPRGLARPVFAHTIPTAAAAAPVVEVPGPAPAAALGALAPAAAVGPAVHLAAAAAAAAALLGNAAECL